MGVAAVDAGPRAGGPRPADPCSRLRAHHAREAHRAGAPGLRRPSGSAPRSTACCWWRGRGPLRRRGRHRRGSAWNPTSGCRIRARRGSATAGCASTDVCLCLRWPTARETSASWLRCLAAGKPTIVTDLVHTADVAVLDPRSWTLCSTRPMPVRRTARPDTRRRGGGGHRPPRRRPLAGPRHAPAGGRRAAPRRRLGRTARAWWARTTASSHGRRLSRRDRGALPWRRPAPLPPPCPDAAVHLELDDGRGRTCSTDRTAAPFEVGRRRQAPPPPRSALPTAGSP